MFPHKRSIRLLTATAAAAVALLAQTLTIASAAEQPVVWDVATRTISGPEPVAG